MMTSCSYPSSLYCDPAINNSIKSIPAELFNHPVSHTSILDLGDKLELDSQRRVTYNSLVYRLTDIIQERVSVARFYVSGSYGRRVSVGKIETDLIVFLRQVDNLPPYNGYPNGLLFKLHSYLVKDFARSNDVNIIRLEKPRCMVEDPPSGLHCCEQDVPNHRCCEDFISVEFGSANNATFRIYLAPALATTPEEQRQATYKKIQEVFLLQRKLGIATDFRCWTPALMEKPSGEMANASAEIQAFIRVCQYWVRSNGIKTFLPYAVETLALLVAKRVAKSNQYQSTSGYMDTPIPSCDLLQSLSKFLSYCCDLTSVRHICEIESPATYISPFTNTPSHVPILLDKFNPYYNLFESLTISDQEQLAFSSQYTLKQLSSATEDSAPNLTLIFSATPRLYTTSKLKKLIYFSLWAVPILVVIIAAVLLRPSSDNHELVETVKDGFDKLSQLLGVWYASIQHWFKNFTQNAIAYLENYFNSKHINP